MIKLSLDLPPNINPKMCVVNSDTLQQFVCFVHSTVMRNLWTKAGVFGSVSMAFGSMLWSQRKTESDEFTSSCTSANPNPSSPYELKLVQVLFRHGARTPLKSIPNVMEVKLFFCFSSTHLVRVSLKHEMSHNNYTILCLYLFVWARLSCHRSNGCQRSWSLQHTPTSII